MCENHEDKFRRVISLACFFFECSTSEHKGSSRQSLAIFQKVIRLEKFNEVLTARASSYLHQFCSLKMNKSRLIYWATYETRPYSFVELFISHRCLEE